MTSFFVLTLVLVAFVKEAQLTKAEACNPNKTRVCLLAYTMSMALSSSCCDVVRQYRISCYYQYKKDPKFKSYLQSPATESIFWLRFSHNLNFNSSFECSSSNLPSPKLLLENFFALWSSFFLYFSLVIV